MFQRAITKLLETNEKKIESFSKEIKSCVRETIDEPNGNFRTENTITKISSVDGLNEFGGWRRQRKESKMREQRELYSKNNRGKKTEEKHEQSLGDSRDYNKSESICVSEALEEEGEGGTGKVLREIMAENLKFGRRLKPTNSGS